MSIQPFQWDKCVHSNGVLQSSFTDPVDKSIYEGQWLDDKKCGYGIRITECGGRYDGMWKNDKFHGYGRLINDEGDVI